MISIIKYISLPVFFVSLVIGLIFAYVLGPEQKIVFMYPTPSKNDFQYKDSANQCFEYKPLEVKCPFNPLSIKSIPVQSN